MASISNLLFFILIKSTGNNIGQTGATSFSDTLKSNTTLMKLNLSGEDKGTVRCKLILTFLQINSHSPRFV